MSRSINSFSAPLIEGQRALVLRFPMQGEWFAVNTPAYRIPSHKTNFLAQRYAFDFTRVDRGDNIFISRSASWRYLLFRVSVTQCLAWSAPILAPASGIVYDAFDGFPDREHLNFFFDYLSLVRLWVKREQWRALTGNYVIIQIDQAFVLLAHLRCGSLSVRPGDRVRSGQAIGQIGNSGNTMIPHLHIQTMDGSDLVAAKGMPCCFERLQYWDGANWRNLHDGIPKRLQTIRTHLDYGNPVA